MRGKWTEKEKQEIFDKAIERIEGGESVVSVFDRPSGENWPTMSGFYDWVWANEEFKVKYSKAAAARAERLFEELAEIADNDDRDKLIAWDGEERPNTAAVARDTLRVNTRKWQLSKMLPAKYGDKIEIDAKHSGEIKINISKEDEDLGV